MTLIPLLNHLLCYSWKHRNKLLFIWQSIMFLLVLPTAILAFIYLNHVTVPKPFNYLVVVVGVVVLLVAWKKFLDRWTGPTPSWLVRDHLRNLIQSNERSLSTGSTANSVAYRMCVPVGSAGYGEQLRTWKCSTILLCYEGWGTDWQYSTDSSSSSYY